jgi:hypothetical protein
VRQVRVTRRRTARRDAAAVEDHEVAPPGRAGRDDAAAVTLRLIDEVLAEG